MLGEREAARRLQESIDRLQQPEIDYVSVKLSAIASQISLVGYQQTLEQLRERLRTIYRSAIAYPAANGSPKFVNLDMEEYRDLQLTVDVFQSVLDEPEFETLEAGMVLQAYLPDAFAVHQALTKVGDRAACSDRGSDQTSAGQRCQPRNGESRCFAAWLAADSLRIQS